MHTHMSHMQICAFKNKLHSSLGKLANKKNIYETELIIERVRKRKRNKIPYCDDNFKSFLGYFKAK